MREFDAARPHLEYNYEQGRHDAVALRLLASTYHHLGLLDEGLSIAKDHADAARGDAALAGVYALLFFDADDIASATRNAETALRLDPKSIEGRIVRAAVLTMRAQMDRARDLLEGVLEDAPRNGRAWINLASLTLLDRDFVTARQQVERGLETMPTHLGSWHLLAWTHLFAGDVDAAERTFNHALELDRTFGETHGALAAIAAIKGEREKAERLRDVAMRLDPDGMSAHFAEAVLAGSAGDAEQARQILTGAASQLEARHGSALTKLLVRSATNAKPPAP